MKVKKQKIVQVVETNLTANSNMVFMNVLYTYSIIYVKEILVERIKKPVIKKKNLSDAGRRDRRRLMEALMDARDVRVQMTRRQYEELRDRMHQNTLGQAQAQQREILDRYDLETYRRMLRRNNEI